MADLAGVSRATISAYLNRTRYVSPEVSQRIEEAIKQLNYAPDPLARALKLRDTQTIGLIIPVLSQFYTPKMRAINEIAHESEYGLLLLSSEEHAGRERELLQVLIAKRISGILLAPCCDENRELLDDIRRSGTPIVQGARDGTGWGGFRRVPGVRPPVRWPDLHYPGHNGRRVRTPDGKGGRDSRVCCSGRI